MKSLVHLQSCALGLCGAVCMVAFGADSSLLSGVVRDAQGHTLGGVEITLTAASSKGPAPSQHHQVSNSSGEFTFSQIAAGDYTLTAGSGGESEPLPVHIPGTTSVNITLQSHPKLQLQASGLHGLIDPGGYSASASANAASGLVKSIADIKRVDNNASLPAAGSWPCNMEADLVAGQKSHPEQAVPDLRLGEFYLAHNQPTKALPLLKLALQLDPSSVDGSRQLALAEMQMGDFQSAHDLLTNLAVRNDTAETRDLLAKADEGLGLFEQAAQEYQKADHEVPSEEDAFGAGYELILAGLPADALKMFEAGRQRYPRSISLRTGVGVAQFLLGHADESVRGLLETVDLNPRDSRAYPFLAEASGVSKVEPERVKSYFANYARLVPENAEANYLYALILSREDAAANAQQIESLLRRALQLNPEMAMAHFELANAYTRRNDYGGAIPEYKSAVHLLPGLKEAHYRLALAYRHVGRMKESESEMREFQTSAADSASRRVDPAAFISVMNAPGEHALRNNSCD